MFLPWAAYLKNLRQIASGSHLGLAFINIILWMDKILHHLNNMGIHCLLVCTGESSSCQGRRGWCLWFLFVWRHTHTTHTVPFFPMGTILLPQKSTENGNAFAGLFEGLEIHQCSRDHSISSFRSFREWQFQWNPPVNCQLWRGNPVASVLLSAVGFSTGIEHQWSFAFWFSRG